MYDSKRVADYYDYAVKNYLSKKELYSSFRAWRRKEKKLKKIQNINPRNSSQYRKEIKP
jgi:uncharacterized radical SAM superfamily Fe-S cluster-containing enzyme